MATLKVKRGAKAGLPASAEAGEPVWATDTGELFFGTGTALRPVLPSGLIVMWSGTLANIPSGWVLCDGQNQTPDLRSKFIKGAAAAANPGATGGSASYTPAGTVGAISASATAAVKIGTSASSGAASNHTHSAPTFTGTAASIEPPYYALAFIMKL